MKIVGASLEARQPLDDVVDLQDHLLSINDLPIEILEKYCDANEFAKGFEAVKQFRQTLEQQVVHEVEELLQSYLEQRYPKKKITLDPRFHTRDGINFISYDFGNKLPLKELHVRVKKRLHESVLRNNLRNEPVLDLIGLEGRIHDPSFNGNPSKKQRDKEASMAYEFAWDFLETLKTKGVIRPFNYIKHYRTTQFFNDSHQHCLEATGVHQKVHHKNVTYYLNILEFQDDSFQSKIKRYLQDLTKQDMNVLG
ncbi:MAG: hypothetical protein ACQESG_01545, partial [Nanobdellota archaeon]